MNTSIELGTYVDKNKYDEFVDQSKDKTIDWFYTKILELNKSISINYEKSAKCQSDFYHWGYVADIETDKAIKDYCEAIILNLLYEAECTDLLLMIDKIDKLNTIYESANKIIADLNKYKPSGYKRTVEILRDIINK